MGLLKTALIGGVAYKLGSRDRKRDDRSCNQCSSCNASSSNSAQPAQQPNSYYQPGYPPQYVQGQPPYGAPQSRSPYDAAHGNYGYQGQSANGGYPTQQSSHDVQEPHMNSAKSSQNAPPPYQQNSAKQTYQNHNEKSPAFSPDQGYQQPRYN